MHILVYIFLWIVGGLLAGIAGDRISDDDTTVRDLFWYGLLGWLILAGFLAIFITKGNLFIKFPESISKFWNKIVIKNKKDMR